MSGRELVRLNYPHLLNLSVVVIVVGLLCYAEGGGGGSSAAHT